MPLSERVREGPLDYFQVYCRMVIPQIEVKIEQQLLQNFLKPIKNEDERREIELAYQQRRVTLAKAFEKDSEDLVESKAGLPPKVSIDALGLVRTVDGDNISTQDMQDIGTYTVFPENHWKRMFKIKAFGQLENMEYERNKTYGVMTREEGLRLTNEMHRLTTPSERNLPYNNIARMGIS